MAFLVCFKKSDCTFDWRDKAIYLDQEFYKLIYYNRDKSRILDSVSKLGYDDEMEIENSELNELKRELVKLDPLNRYPKIKSLLEVIDVSISSKYNLMIAGDMHPVLR